MNDNVFLRPVCFHTLSVHLYQDVMKCLRLYTCVRLEHVQLKDRTRKRAVDYICIHITCLGLCVTGRAKNERVSYQKCMYVCMYVCVCVYIYIYIWSHDQLQIQDLFCIEQNQMHGCNWKHKAHDFSVNRFLKLINLPMTTTFLF